MTAPAVVDVEALYADMLVISAKLNSVNTEDAAKVYEAAALIRQQAEQIERLKKYDPEEFKKKWGEYPNHDVYAADCVYEWRKDAKRYQWLRICLDRDVRVLMTDRLDAAIDEARERPTTSEAPQS